MKTIWLECGSSLPMCLPSTKMQFTNFYGASDKKGKNLLLLIEFSQLRLDRFTQAPKIEMRLILTGLS